MGKTNIIVVGAGKGGNAVINLLHNDEAINILYVADVDNDAPGMKLARELGIPTSTDYRNILNKDGLDLIINTTGSDEVQKDIQGLKHPATEVIGGHSTKIMVEIFEKHKAGIEKISRSRDAFLNMLQDIADSYKDLEELFISLMMAMVNALDAKSPWTKGHSTRVAMYAKEAAREMGLGEEELKNLELAGLLHDIGKIGTYDYLLDKPGKLTDEEFEIIKKHPAQGEKILGGIKQLKDIIPIIKYHHERMDGRGYPDGLKGDDIPLSARILHVADTFDAIMADRPYRQSPGIEYAIAELKKWSGSQFDKEVVEAFLKALTHAGKTIDK